jgi:hypothetical protein
LYVVAAGLVAALAIVSRKPKVFLLAGAITVLPAFVRPLEHVFHNGVYWHGWELVGYEEATTLSPIRDPTVASNLQSWYGPVGLALTVAAAILVVRATLRGSLPRVAVVLAISPFVLLLGAAMFIGYHPFNGRFVMAGVALSAATWGIVRPFRAPAIATVVVATTGVALALVNYSEKPAGIDLLEGTDRQSIWELPREWAQSIQPEVARLIGYVDDRALSGSTVAVSRDKAVYPFAYVGYPEIEHEIVYADSLSEASRRRADWAVLPLRAGCQDGWRLELRSPPWAVYRQAPGVTCR